MGANCVTNIADTFTKDLPKDKFERFRDQIMSLSKSSNFLFAFSGNTSR